jgi:hypothetical protein
LRGIAAFDGPAVAAHCKVPTIHLAAASPFNPPHLMSQWLPNVVHGQTVGAGHINQLETPEQVNLMIEISCSTTCSSRRRPAVLKVTQRTESRSRTSRWSRWRLYAILRRRSAQALDR